jgi:hypothetical protein
MDILAHTLWAGVGVALLGRRVPIKPGVATAILALAALPDVFQMLPVLAWWSFGSGTFDAVKAFAISVPGHEPIMPAMITLVSHHTHCTAHSALVAGVVTLIAWRVWAWLLIPLLGWWSHILIDVFTHSTDYYPSPILYPITQRGFDGIAWNTPWFMSANYAALALVALFIVKTAKRKTRA